MCVIQADPNQLVNLISTVVLTSLGHGAREVLLEETVESDSNFDPFSLAPCSLPAGFRLPRSHEKDMLAARAASAVLDPSVRRAQRDDSESASGRGQRAWGNDSRGLDSAKTLEKVWAVFSVRDDAPGREEGEMVRLFKPFENLRLGDLHDGMSSGSGLSFFVLRRVVSELGGAAWVAARAERQPGNVLFFAIPAQLRQQPPPSPAAAEPAPAPGAELEIRSHSPVEVLVTAPAPAPEPLDVQPCPPAATLVVTPMPSPLVCEAGAVSAITHALRTRGR